MSDRNSLLDKQSGLLDAIMGAAGSRLRDYGRHLRYSRSGDSIMRHASHRGHRAMLSSKRSLGAVAARSQASEIALNLAT
jgi:hypothetical protein